jgi:hypothetical protein
MLLNEENSLQGFYPNSPPPSIFYIGTDVSEVRSLLFREVTQRRLVISSTGLAWPFKMWPIVCPETSVIVFLSFSLLIGWQLSIWNCCKPFFSLLYNCQLLCFWRLAVSIVGEVFPRPFFTDIASSRMFTTNSLCVIVCRIQCTLRKTPEERISHWNRGGYPKLPFGCTCWLCFQLSRNL